MPNSIPRAYLVAGTLEPFFLENATRWAVALREAGADVVMTERVGSHGGRVLARRVPADGGVGIWTVKRPIPCGPSVACSAALTHQNRLRLATVTVPAKAAPRF